MPSPGKTERAGLIQELASRLRFPQLFAVAALLFLIDLVIPDAIPFLDEILLGLLTVLFGTWRKNRGVEEEERVVKNVTPKGE